MIFLHLLNQPESTWIREDRCEGVSDTSLSSLGKKQTVIAGLSLTTQNINQITVGTLHRTVQAGKLLIKIFPLKLKRDKRLIDINFGIWQGKFPEEIETRFPDIYKIWKSDPEKAIIPDGETLQSVKDRIQSFLSDHQSDQLFDQHIILVSHDIIIRIILTLIEGKKLNKIWSYQLDPASLTKVAIYPEKKVIEINNIEHLKRKETQQC